MKMGRFVLSRGLVCLLILALCPQRAEGSGPTIVEEWLVQLGAQSLSSPIISEVAGGADKEIVITTFCPESACPGNPFLGGRVFVLNSDGGNLAGWPQSSANAPFSGGAVVGDIDGDGDMEVVAGSWNQAFVWNRDGTSFPGWPKPVGTFGTPALADLDGNGDLEVVYASAGGDLVVWNHDGTVFPGWPYSWTGGTGAGFIMAPAVADIDGDGDLEIAAGTGQGAFTEEPHDFFVWESDGSVRLGFPVTTKYQEDGASIGDFDADGLQEMVFSDNRFEGQDQLFLVNSDGSKRPGWPVLLPEIGNSAPALGDLTGNGELEIVIGGAELVDVTCIHPRLFALDQLGNSLPGFPVNLASASGGVCPVIAPVILVDLDGDRDIEILVKYRDNISAYHGDGSLMAGFPYALSDDGVSSSKAPGPAADDVDGDGRLEFVFVSASGRVAYFDTAALTSIQTRPWPMYKHSPQGRSDFGPLYVFSDGFESGDTSAWSVTLP